jgi:hypothetical protein
MLQMANVEFIRKQHVKLGVPPHAHQANNEIVPQNEKNTLFFL